uniref:Complex III subunit 9 n=1 Tax=Syphacia muris TaxID=451379 RepID=A0A0N5AQE3_9BILA
MGSYGTFIYKAITRRFSTLFLTAVVGAYVVETVIVRVNDYYWEQHNKGKLWKDVKARLEAEGKL